MIDLMSFKKEISPKKPVQKILTRKGNELEMQKKTSALDSFLEASQRLSPLWDVRDCVAVNPFFGFKDKSFLETAKWLKSFSGKSILPQKKYFLKKYTLGQVAHEDLETARLLSSSERAFASSERPTIEQLVHFIQSPVENNQEYVSPKCVSDLYDLKNHGDKKNQIVVEVSKWSAAFFDESQAVWKIPHNGMSFFSWWKNLAQYDQPFKDKKKSWPQLVRSLPDDPSKAIEILSEKLFKYVPLESWQMTNYFYGLIESTMGWSSFFKKFDFEANRSGQNSTQSTGLADIVAVRMTYDMALLDPDLDFKYLLADSRVNSKEIEYSYLWLMASEIAYRRNVEDSIKKHHAVQAADSSPDFQAVFCIDVRSEILRRHLENLSPHIQTLGFAGFFGLPISLKALGYQQADQNCPVLLNPVCEISETANEKSSYLKQKKSKVIESLYLRKAIQSSANSGFSFMETLGFGYIPRIIRSSFGYKPNFDISTLGISREDRKHIHLDLSHLSLDQKTNFAFGALKNMGLTKNFARYVFFFGHGSESANNPYSSALDCGACAGHNGKGNASLLAGILNAKEVRIELARQGINIPESTTFLSGWHHTTKDELILEEDEAFLRLSPDQLEKIRDIFEKATANCRQERAEKLPLPTSSGSLDLRKELHRRANDWSEIRPEWGLARNASFIVGRRELTRGLSLDGRAFLHDYDLTGDQDLSVLELIMTAPMIVTNWINMQYYASTVEPQKFGAGNKVLNNVVGGIGCIQGNEGDLLTGLTEQSVRHRGEYFHEPLRLQVFIEAPLSAIESIIAKHQVVKDLVSNGWMAIISIDPQTKDFKLYQPEPGLNPRQCDRGRRP